MALNAKSTPFFFIFDFYLMKGASDANDVVPEAILYFYPVDNQLRQLKTLDCGEIIGVIHYFQHDLFHSIPRVLYFQKNHVVHDHHGRHSAFLCMPQDRGTPEESKIHLKHILNLFNMLYGTWNHAYSIFEKDNEFLNKALTPIVSYVCNQHRSITQLFSIVEYASLKPGNQRTLLESKHCLEYLKSKHGLYDGFIGYDNKILYSTWDADTTFYIQLLFQLEKDLPKDYIFIPWESEFKLKNGVSLFRIYIRRSENSTPLKTTTTTTTTNDDANASILTTITAPKIVTTPPMNIFDDLPSGSEDSSSLRSRFSFASSPSYNERRRCGILLLTDPSGSSEGSGFDTDTMDEISSFNDKPSLSSESIDESLNKIIKQDINEDDVVSPSSTPAWFDESITDEQKLELKNSRSSTIDNEIEKTIEIDREENLNEPDDKIHITEIDPYEDIDDYPVTRRKLSNSSRDRGRTMTSNSDSSLPDSHKNDRHEVRLSWTNIPDKNNEPERDELVLYVQKNSRMMFAGIMEQSLLTDEYLNKLWNLMLSHMAYMDTDIQTTSTANDALKISTDVKFQFNEHTHQFLEIDRVYDGIRHYRKLPSEESTYMALFARMELDRNSERKVIGLSRGSYLISADRQKPDRTIYSSRRSQDIFS